MKRVPLSVLAVCLLAGQVSADPFTLTKDQAMSLDEVRVTGGGSYAFWGATDDFATYEADTMLGAVGYTGYLQRGSIMTLGATAGDLGRTGAYTGFQLFLANDNDDPWQATLYVDGLTSPAFQTLVPGTGNTFLWNFGESITLLQDTFIGFTIKSGVSRTDFFHISAVPAPAAVLIGVLGLGVAGLKLRKFV